MNRPKPTVLLLFGLLACGDATAPLTPADFAGHYTLRTVNGREPPQTVPARSEGCTVRFDAGSLILADGAFVMHLSFVDGICPGLFAAAHTFEPIGGGLTVEGNALTLRAIDPSGRPFTASVTLAGRDAVLTLPAGALGIATSVVLTFGPRVA